MNLGFHRTNISMLALATALASCHAAQPAGPSGAAQLSSQSSGQSSGQSSAQGAAPSPGQLPNQPPALVVLLVIDQLPSWSFATDRDVLTDGLERLMHEGTYVPRAELPYAISYTAPGHASIGTGAPPSRTHILANSWYRPALGQSLSAAEDPDSPVFEVNSLPAGPNNQKLAGISGKQLAVEGIADVLERATGGAAKTVSISLKDRAAVFMLGRRPDLAVWYEPDILAMTTSAYYTAAVPGWLATLAREKPIQARLGTVWTPLGDLDHEKLTGWPDAAPGEGAEYGLGIEFPHDLAKAANPARALRAVPAGNEIVLETALAALEGEELGKDEIPDLLALSFSAHDYAGHNWGQDSWERLDMLVRLDRALGEFLATLDQRVGKHRYAVVLTSDHGATRVIERSLARGHKAHRILVDDVERAANQAASGVLGNGAWIAETMSSSLYMSKAFASQPESRRNAAMEAIQAGILTIPGITYAVRTSRILGNCEQRAGNDALACFSVVPGLSGELFFAPDGLSLISNYTFGTSHGSLSDDDRFVPIILWAPGAGVTPRVVTEPVTLLQVVPTLAALLRIAPPEAAKAAPIVR